jgi:Family of unknown function (DUF6056)
VAAIRAYLWWALLVVPLWLVLILCSHWEPVMGDGWGHARWHFRYDVELKALYDMALGSYRYENPRLGQLVTLLAYTPGPYHAIVAPLVELGILALLTTLALGRWPSLGRADDAFAAALVTAIVAACVPQLGPMLFYRPFAGNYTFGLALHLLWLVPYRLELAAPRPPRVWLAPVMLVLGVAVGLCNEHTGLAFLAMGLAASIARLRRGGLRLWMIAGLVGLAAGYVVLLTAPGQDLRYLGLAAQAGILERITGRGVAGNLRVVGILAGAMVWALPLVAIGLVERRTGPASLTPTARWVGIALALGGLACTLTLLASPKIGPRLYFASVALIAAGLAGWLAAQVRRRWARRACVILAAGVLIYVEVRLVAIYRTVGPLGAIRLERIQRAARTAPGSVVVVPRYPVGPSRYFLGDDFAAQRRADLAIDYGLEAVELEPAEPAR